MRRIKFNKALTGITLKDLLRILKNSTYNKNENEQLKYIFAATSQIKRINYRYINNEFKKKLFVYRPVLSGI